MITSNARNRFLAACVTMLLLLSSLQNFFIPVYAADNETVYDLSKQSTSLNITDFPKPIRFTGTLNPGIQVNLFPQDSSIEVTLDNVSIHTGSFSFRIKGPGTVVITLMGDNAIDGLDIYGGTFATIRGSGTLAVTSENSPAITLSDATTLTIMDGAMVKATGPDSHWDIAKAPNGTGGSTLNIEDGATVELGNTGIDDTDVSFTAVSIKDCTIVGTGAEAQGIDGVYDADGYRPLATIPAIAVKNGENTQIPHNGTRTLEITNAASYTNPTYQWYKDGAAIANETGETLTVSEAGAYKLEVVTSDDKKKGESTATTLTKEGAPLPGQHNITVAASPAAGGSPTASQSSAATSTQITLEAKPNSGYTFDRWETTSPGVTFTDPSAESTTFTMPDNDVNITAHYISTDPDYTLTLQAGYGGYITLGASGSYAENDLIDIGAQANTGYRFTGWTTSGGGSFGNAYSAATTFTMPASAVAVTANFASTGGGYVPPYNPPSRDRSDDSGGGSSQPDSVKSTSSAPANTPKDVTTAAATAAAKDAAAQAKASGASVATVRIKNPGNISLEALQAMSKAAGMPVRFQADSMSADGKSVEVRITLDPAKATQALNLSASTTNATAKARKALFEKWYENKVQTISFGQQGSFGQPVEIAAKVDLTGMDTENLYFYSYDKASNSYKRIEKPNYWIDKNGYLHFTTELAGDIIISNGPLQKK